jgi:hypothetical protein
MEGLAMSYNLDEINARRRRVGKKPLSASEARAAVRSYSSNSGVSMTDFLIGHATGVGYNVSSHLGSLTHHSETPRTSDTNFGGGSGGSGLGGGDSDIDL